MTVKVEFMGYINRVREYDWGVVYDVAHNQQQKKDGQWRTTGRDYFSVVGPEGAAKFNENDMVYIRGTLKTAVFDKKDGSGKGIALNVRAEDISKQATVENAKSGNNAVQQVWPEVASIAEDNAPF